jgi:hypothetical protein
MIKRAIGSAALAICFIASIANTVMPVVMAIINQNAVWFAWWAAMPGTVALFLGALVLRDILWED